MGPQPAGAGPLSLQPPNLSSLFFHWKGGAFPRGVPHPWGDPRFSLLSWPCPVPATCPTYRLCAPEPPPPPCVAVASPVPSGLPLLSGSRPQALGPVLCPPHLPARYTHPSKRSPTPLTPPQLRPQHIWGSLLLRAALCRGPGSHRTHNTPLPPGALSLRPALRAASLATEARLPAAPAPLGAPAPEAADSCWSTVSLQSSIPGRVCSQDSE